MGKAISLSLRISLNAYRTKELNHHTIPAWFIR